MVQHLVRTTDALTELGRLLGLLFDSPRADSDHQ